MLASLFNIPSTPESLLEFSFANQDQHIQIAQRVRQTQGINLQQYPLDPIPNNALEFWLQIHQRSHADFEAALGIGGFDLSTVDFSNADQLNSWIRLHAEVHRQAALKLNIG